MGVCCFQERSREEPSSRTIRVVHIDGLIEDFESPTTVNEIIGYFTRHFLTTPIQILQVGLIPLKNDTKLEPGRIYFLLPYAITRFNESSVDLLPLTKKLIKIAKTRRSIAKPSPRLPSSVIPQNKEPSQIIAPPPSVAKVAKTTNSKAKPPRAPKKKSLTKKLSNIAKTRGLNDPPASQGSNDSSNADQNNNVVVRRNKMMSWKPLLSTIREISFNRRESDLRD
ncbi:hypothetical protein CTI12_AA164450 [Artemisia annua]|uniref:Uncharacterized protein n=1 Tax=Artemisia annua TaxID=35608 RepID=A0A2U1NPE7_ARTAN|nr:hypothetical protein CTI12_AA164450 [Artemisia annua]